MRITRRRTLRRSEGTVSVEGIRYQVPQSWRHVRETRVRYARWDLVSVDLVDGRSGERLCTLYPLDKRANADGVRRRGGHIVRTRLAGIARAAGVALDTLDIAVIDVPRLRLDHCLDRQRLLETVERIGPRLLVLAPLVRLHGVDENTVAAIAPILGFLRDLQRRFHTAVLLVHHSRKSGATRPGQALRGTGELHAWGDSNLYLRRRGAQIFMTVEHRAAPGLNDVEIEFGDDGEGPALRVRGPLPGEAAPEPETLGQRILAALGEAAAPLSQRQIRERAATRPATVTKVLDKFIGEGRVERVPKEGYRIAAGEGATPTAGAVHSTAPARRDRKPLPARTPRV